MPLVVHPEALRSFEARGEMLVTAVTREPARRKPSQSANPDFHIAQHISGADIIGEPSVVNVDGWGHELGRLFTHEGNQLGLFGDNHREFVRLVESIHRLPGFAAALSRKFLAEVVFGWVRSRYRSEHRASLMDHVLTTSNAAIGPREIWIPIFFTAIAHELQIGYVTIKQFEKKALDSWAAVISANSDIEGKQAGEHRNPSARDVLIGG